MKKKDELKRKRGKEKLRNKQTGTKENYGY